MARTQRLLVDFAEIRPGQGIDELHPPWRVHLVEFGPDQGTELLLGDGGPGGEDGAGPLLVRGPDLIRAAAGDLAAGTAPAVIAARFHNGVAAAIVAVCERLRDGHGLGTVALSGGVFQNLLLTARAVAGLTDRGFRVLVHARVPCNDGGISFGQAAVAAATVT